MTEDMINDTTPIQVLNPIGDLRFLLTKVDELKIGYDMGDITLAITTPFRQEANSLTIVGSAKIALTDDSLDHILDRAVAIVLKFDFIDMEG